MTQGQNQTGFFGQRDELCWRNNAPKGVPPAHQRLGSRDAALGIDLGLVMQQQLVVLQSFTQIGFQRRPGHHHGVCAQRKQLRPVPLAWYMARSARLSNSSTVLFSRAKRPTPILAVQV